MPGSVVAVDPPARDDSSGLDRPNALYEAAEHLPAEERELFGPTFHHDRTQSQIAELFG